MKLITRYDPPPVPGRTFDWIAYDDNLGCELGCPVGYGATEADAVGELMEQLDERSQTLLQQHIATLATPGDGANG